MNGLALCAGVGGLERGIESILPRARTVCFVEGETYPASVLASKMEAGSLPKAPIWSNVRTFDGKPWRGKVSFLSGGFPCQPYSKAGKQLADKDPRDLWPDFARIIGEVRPNFIFLENVANVVKWALPTVLEDLSKMGYDASWCVVAASEVGAPHKRSRWFLFAYTKHMANPNSQSHSKPQRTDKELRQKGSRLEGWEDERKTGYIVRSCCEKICHSNSHRLSKHSDAKGCQRIIGKRQLAGNRLEDISYIDTGINQSNHWEIEPGMGRMVDGVADWVHRMRACGNGVVPQQAAYAYSILMQRCGFMVSKS